MAERQDVVRVLEFCFSVQKTLFSHVNENIRLLKISSNH